MVGEGEGSVKGLEVAVSPADCVHDEALGRAVTADAAMISAAAAVTSRGS